MGLALWYWTAKGGAGRESAHSESQWRHFRKIGHEERNVRDSPRALLSDGSDLL